MVVGHDETLVARVKVLAPHRMSKDAWHRFGDQDNKHYQVVGAGFKYSMMDLLAAIDTHQPARIEQNWERRRAVWNRYMQAFPCLPVGLPAPPAAGTRHAARGTRHANHLFTIMLDEARCGISRDGFLDAMTACRIGTGVHSMSVPEHPYYP